MSRPRRVYRKISVSPDSYCTNMSVDNPEDLKDVQIREQTRKVEALEESCQDLDSTITQFRDLVLQLQTCVYHAAPILSFVTDGRTVNSIPSERKRKQLSMNLLLQHHKRLL
jgi:hypothetical protein